jgi:hypothetical protein
LVELHGGSQNERVELTPSHVQLAAFMQPVSSAFSSHVAPLLPWQVAALMMSRPLGQSAHSTPKPE